MLKLPKLFVPAIAMLLTSAFLVFLIFLGIWLIALGFAEIVYTAIIFFSAVIFLAVGYFCMKISNLKKEKRGLARFLKEDEKKLINLKIEKNRLSNIFANFNEGILAIDKENRILTANPMAKKILGIKARDIKGLNVADLARTPNLKPYAGIFLASNGVFKKEARLNNFTVEFFSAPLTIEGKNSGRLIVLRDITQQNLLEKTKNELILSTAHQIKTSAASLKWSIGMILSRDFGKVTKEQEDIMERLYKKNDALISLARNLIYAAKIENAAPAPNKTPTDIQHIVESVIYYFKDEIKGKKIKVRFDKPSRELPKIMADREKINLAVQNLISNALEYTPSGGRIGIFIVNNEKEIKFSIKDSGMGIPEEQQLRIFDKFFRADNAAAVKTGGSGLGLFTAKKIIEEHGGRIWFNSEENKGSAFYFTLPLK